MFFFVVVVVVAAAVVAAAAAAAAAVVVVVVVVVVVRNAPYLQRDKGPSLYPTLVAQQGTFQPSGSVISRTSGKVKGYKQERCSYNVVGYIYLYMWWWFYSFFDLFWFLLLSLHIVSSAWWCCFSILFWLDLKSGYDFAGKYSILSPRFL